MLLVSKKPPGGEFGGSKKEEPSEVRITMANSGRGILLYLLDTLQDTPRSKDVSMFTSSWSGVL